MNAPSLDFVSVQVHDLQASAAFYEQRLGFTRIPGPPHAVVFRTGSIPFAVREPEPGADLAGGRPGLGVALWMHAADVEALHLELVAAGATIVTPPFDGPFGRTFTVADPDGYRITLHDKA